MDVGGRAERTLLLFLSLGSVCCLWILLTAVSFLYVFSHFYKFVILFQNLIRFLKTSQLALFGIQLKKITQHDAPLCHHGVSSANLGDGPEWQHSGQKRN